MRSSRDPLDIKPLSGEVLNDSDPDQSNRLFVLLDGFQYVLGPNDGSTLFGVHFNQSLVLRETVQIEVGADSVVIAAKRLSFDEDLVPRQSGSVKGDKEQVVVHRERVHNGNLVVVLSTDNRAHQRDTGFIHRGPRTFALKVALDAVFPPFRKLLIAVRLCSFR